MKLVKNNELLYSNLQLKPLLNPRVHEFTFDTNISTVTESSDLITNLNELNLPPIFKKIIKRIKQNEIIEIVSTNIKKLIPVFPDKLFKEGWVNEGDKVEIYINLLQVDKVLK